MTATAVREHPILFSGPMTNALLAGRKRQTRRVVNESKILSSDQKKRGWQCSIEHAHVGDVGRMIECPTRPVCQQLLVPARHPHDASIPWVDCGCERVYAPWEPGDILWVRETFKIENNFNSEHYEPDNPLGPVCWHDDEEYGRWFECARYKASEPDAETVDDDGNILPWKPSIFMPRWAPRIVLEVESVRVERLQEITEADSQAEGFEPVPWGTWWQGYRDLHGQLLHQCVPGDEPPKWMLEPKKDATRPDLDKTARRQFRLTWDALNAKRKDQMYAWDRNPWVWCVGFKILTTKGGLP